MTWVVIAWCVVMAVWIISALALGDSGDCARKSYRGACEAGEDTGRGIAVIVLWFVWFFGFIALSLIWFMTRPKGRECPACGKPAKKGQATCLSCGHDFAAAAQPLAVRGA